MEKVHSELREMGARFVSRPKPAAPQSKISPPVPDEPSANLPDFFLNILASTVIVTRHAFTLLTDPQPAVELGDIVMVFD